MDKIDIVYLWVDGSDKKWRAQKEKWLAHQTDKQTTKCISAGAERWRDNGELKYSLRSLAENAPWVNHIYIVTGFNQVPKWLNKKHPKITIVPHKTIFPSDALPTFNSTAIDMCLHNIPGLSERFLLLNDDMFFNKPLKSSFFFDHRGRAKNLYIRRKINYKRLGWILDGTDVYRSKIILTAKKIHEIYGRKLYKYSPSHGIDAYIKSSWTTCRNHPMLKQVIDKQVYNKFRTNWEFQRWIFTLSQYVHGHATFRRAHPHKSGRNKILDAFYNTIHFASTRRSSYLCSCVLGHEKSLRVAPIFCINDSDKNTPQMLRANAEFLKQRFPTKSKFEK
ncbi:MAG: Stealth CR1 domain-containing protein [Alphaproteobacteria bacterium]|nr:Stealth CR1 domain-containing protein [Alphaproteobacteria bacterium]